MKLILFVGENETSTDNIKCTKQCVRKSDYCRLGKKPVLPFRPGKKRGHKSDFQENANKVKFFFSPIPPARWVKKTYPLLLRKYEIHEGRHLYTFMYRTHKKASIPAG